MQKKNYTEAKIHRGIVDLRCKMCDKFFFLLFEVDRRIKEKNKLISPKLLVFEQKHFLNSHEHFLTYQEP